MSNKEWWKKNKEKQTIYNKRFYQKHRLKMLERAKEYRKNNKIKIKKRWKENYPIKKDLYNKNRLNKNRYNLETWRDFVYIKNRCEICNKKIYFNNGKRNVVNFDHKYRNVPILPERCPTDWLKKNKRTPKNEKIWLNCNFGSLCSHCNRFLPLKNRKQFVKNLIKYVFSKRNVLENP